MYYLNNLRFLQKILSVFSNSESLDYLGNSLKENWILKSRFSRKNDDWVGLIVHLCTDSYFGIEVLGLGHLELIDNNLEPYLRFGLPKLCLDSHSDKSGYDRAIINSFWICQISNKNS